MKDVLSEAECCRKKQQKGSMKRAKGRGARGKILGTFSPVGWRPTARADLKKRQNERAKLRQEERTHSDRTAGRYVRRCARTSIRLDRLKVCPISSLMRPSILSTIIEAGSGWNLPPRPSTSNPHHQHGTNILLVQYLVYIFRTFFSDRWKPYQYNQPHFRHNAAPSPFSLLDLRQP